MRHDTEIAFINWMWQPGFTCNCYNTAVQFFLVICSLCWTSHPKSEKDLKGKKDIGFVQGIGSYDQKSKAVSQPLGRVPLPGLEDLFTGTWNIRETKQISEITMKSFYRDLDLKMLRTTGLRERCTATSESLRAFVIYCILRI